MYLCLMLVSHRSRSVSLLLSDSSRAGPAAMLLAGVVVTCLKGELPLFLRQHHQYGHKKLAEGKQLAPAGRDCLLFPEILSVPTKQLDFITMLFYL